MNATRRAFKPNLVKRSFKIGEKVKQATVCTRCIRTMDKNDKTLAQTLKI